MPDISPCRELCLPTRLGVPSNRSSGNDSRTTTSEQASIGQCRRPSCEFGTCRHLDGVSEVCIPGEGNSAPVCSLAASACVRQRSWSLGRWLRAASELLPARIDGGERRGQDARYELCTRLLCSTAAGAAADAARRATAAANAADFRASWGASSGGCYTVSTFDVRTEHRAECPADCGSERRAVSAHAVSKAGLPAIFGATGEAARQRGLRTVGIDIYVWQRCRWRWIG